MIRKMDNIYGSVWLFLFQTLRILINIFVILFIAGSAGTPFHTSSELNIHLGDLLARVL